MEAKDLGAELTLTPLNRKHDVESFSCGREALDNFLKRFALSHPAHGLSQTWVFKLSNNRVVGYFTLSASTINISEATERVAKGMPRYPIPVVLLARIAVDKDFQGQGLGRLLMIEAMRKAADLGIAIADNGLLPLRALLVHAKDEVAAKFYEKFGLERSPTDALHLMILLKAIEESFKQGD